MIQLLPGGTGEQRGRERLSGEESCRPDSSGDGMKGQVVEGPSENVGGEREGGIGAESSPGVGSPGDGKKTDGREAGSVPCFGGGRGGFHVGLAELEGLVGHWGGDVSRKSATCV